MAFAACDFATASARDSAADFFRRSGFGSHHATSCIFGWFPALSLTCEQ